jgi:hypothetical protein
MVAGCIGGDDSGTGGNATGTDAPTEAATEAPAEGETETGTSEATEGGEESDISGSVSDTEDGLEVTNHEIYRQNGEVGVQGTVQNTADQAYAFVEAEVSLQDDQGEILYEFIDETEEESTPQLEAGSEWQFQVVFEEAQLSEVSQYTLDIDGYPTTDADFGAITGEVDDQDENLEILSTHLTRQESETFVRGAVRNVGGEAAENVEVNATLYDDNNNELFDFNDTVEQEEEVQQLAPNQIWKFRVVFDDIDMQQVARYVVTANSELV